MNKPQRQFAVLAALLLFAFMVALYLLLVPSQGGPAGEQLGIGLPSETVRARVVEITETGEITLGNVTQPYQVMQVELLEGDYQGFVLEVDIGRRGVRPDSPMPAVGETVLVNAGKNQSNVVSAFFVDFVRLRPLAVAAAAFALLSILISGWKGVRGLIGMAISLAVILFYIIPNILRGGNPVLVSVTGAFFLLSVTLYLVYGWNLKTHAAVLGTLIALALTGVLAAVFTDYARLTGFGSEDALFLIQQSEVQINLRGLVLGGMLIGSLGVLDDLVITQASVVFALHTTNPSLGLRSLFRRAMLVGQDHVAATVNTLVLAYAGAALPTLLLFSLSGAQFTQVVNYEFVAEEIVRTLVGSIGLIAAVPLTTGLACLIVLHHDRLGALRAYLGPIPGDDHVH